MIPLLLQVYIQIVCDTLVGGMPIFTETLCCWLATEMGPWDICRFYKVTQYLGKVSMLSFN